MERDAASSNGSRRHQFPQIPLFKFAFAGPGKHLFPFHHRYFQMQRVYELKLSALPRTTGALNRLQARVIGLAVQHLLHVPLDAGEQQHLRQQSLRAGAKRNQ